MKFEAFFFFNPGRVFITPWKAERCIYLPFLVFLHPFWASKCWDAFCPLEMRLPSESPKTQGFFCSGWPTVLLMPCLPCVTVVGTFSTFWVSENSAAVNGLPHHHSQPGAWEGAEQGRMALVLEFLVYRRNWRSESIHNNKKATMSLPL